MTIYSQNLGVRFKINLKYSGTCKLANNFINIIGKVSDTINF